MTTHGGPADERRDDTLEVLWDADAVERPVAPSRDDERASLVAALKGRASALSGILVRHAAAAWRFAAINVLDTDRATDVTADTFADVIEHHREVLGAPRSFRCELLARTRRSATFDGLNNLDEIDLSRAPQLPFDDTDDPGHVVSTFALLADPDRVAVWLDGVEGLDARSIRDVLGDSSMLARERVEAARTSWRAAIGEAQVWAAEGGRCVKAVERIDRYLDGTLEAADVGVFHRHVAGCAACTARLDAAEDPVTCLVAALVPPPSDLSERLAARLDPTLRVARFG